MRRIFARAVKKEKQTRAHLDQEVINSKEYQALIHTNAIMNLYDAIEKLGYDPLEGDEYYIQARFQAHAFATQLLETLSTQLVSKNDAE